MLCVLVVGIAAVEIPAASTLCFSAAAAVAATAAAAVATILHRKTCALGQKRGSVFPELLSVLDVSLLVTVYLEPVVAQVGGEESLATVTDVTDVSPCRLYYASSLQ